MEASSMIAATATAGITVIQQISFIYLSLRRAHLSCGTGGMQSAGWKLRGIYETEGMLLPLVPGLRLEAFGNRCGIAYQHKFYQVPDNLNSVQITSVVDLKLHL
ncbi:uncharacterized protein LOC105275091 [Ooceraea biroi]|uniref:uncharacterized protein LOC105275091 n=1 Tax=Ooceraea biroi TaxID=2015173 RepID=UPI000F095ACA|nr:uncharacterized protein LOC105275091 [Ooceraea biroi]